MRSPQGEILVMLELWCARAWVDNRILPWIHAKGNIDPIRRELVGIFRRYFPEDEYLKNLEKRQ